MAVEPARNLTFRRDPAGEGSYHKVSDKPVAYSKELAALVIADFDASGAVRGIDFVGKQVHPIGHYLELARKASSGPVAKKRGAIPGVG